MDWRDKAMCREEDPELFFPVGNRNSAPMLLQTEEAKAVCRRCPVMEKCLDWALGAGPVVEGVWGGTSESERLTIRRRMSRRSRAAVGART
ncbi:WhiB family transcriptional regulator [Streptomyces sp. ADI93-02]|uniref:WhiB family transcriptional regulator n=1 Tax=Streptomyces sp. ADI93-02 TaxID=1522757 RepID=UPI000F559537|nr:WhiB family transcriptional regulator [Streptomyces sp. ADI93-02]RPK32208.1 Transcriptional regulator WhiB1 [Streptomyces sp. ADI93-02]